MHLLAIGGAGTVGRALAPHLSTWRQRVLDRAPAEGIGESAIRGDARDAGVLRAAMDDIDAVLYLAAVVPRGAEVDEPARVQAAFDVNVTALYLALRTAAEAGVTSFVHLSTMSVFAGYGQSVVDVRSSPDATQPYGLTKRLAEQLCASVATTTTMTITSLRLAFPTTDDVWPLWAPPTGAPPQRPRLADGTEFPALAPEDLARAVESTLARRGTYAALPVTGDVDQVSLTGDDTFDVLGWRPLRR